MCYGVKVIFLDIDGVLNDVESKTREPKGYIGIDDAKVRLLRKIVEETKANIVLTSTWKKWWEHNDEDCDTSGHYMNQKLRKEQLRIIDKTDYMNERGQGISEWLVKHPNVTAWAVLDDDVFDDFEEYGIMPHLVKTDFHRGGLKETHVERAIQLLNNAAS